MLVDLINDSRDFLKEQKKSASLLHSLCFVTEQVGVYTRFSAHLKAVFFTSLQNLRWKTNKMRVNINSLFPVIPSGPTEVVIKNSPFYWKSFSVRLHSTDQCEELFFLSNELFSASHRQMIINWTLAMHFNVVCECYVKKIMKLLVNLTRFEVISIAQIRFFQEIFSTSNSKRDETNQQLSLLRSAKRQSI